MKKTISFGLLDIIIFPLRIITGLPVAIFFIIFFMLLGICYIGINIFWEVPFERRLMSWSEFDIKF